MKPVPLPLSQVVAWLFERAPGVFGDWSTEKLARWVLHHARENRLVTVREPRQHRILCVMLWQRLPDDVAIDDAMAWGWQKNATAGSRIYVSALVGKIPFSDLARLIHAVAFAPGVRRVVCHRRKQAHDITAALNRYFHGISEA